MFHLPRHPALSTATATSEPRYSKADTKAHSRRLTLPSTCPPPLPLLPPLGPQIPAQQLAAQPPVQYVPVQYLPQAPAPKAAAAAAAPPQVQYVPITAAQYQAMQAQHASALMPTTGAPQLVQRFAGAIGGKGVYKAGHQLADEEPAGDAGDAAGNSTDTKEEDEMPEEMTPPTPDEIAKVTHSPLLAYNISIKLCR